MALTYGFYNSIEGDRKYDATQVSRIFDGIIKDGVYATYEKALMVIASENAGEVIIQPGRAWFNHTWSYNDANLIMQAPAPEVLLDRIDALVLEVNEELAVRANSFKWVQGTPSSRPENPTLTNTSTVHQYPLCYIHRYPETTMIYTRDITNMIGTSECPFVTGVLEGIDLDAWINQWDNEFHNWENTTKTSFETWMLNQESTYTAWETAMKAQMADDIEDVEEWVETIRNIIDAETATHLQNEIDELRSEITAGSHIIISTSETELFGREVTITTEEGVVLTEEFDSNGVADFKSVPYVGNLTVSSSYGTETAERIISTPYYARYTFTLAFWSATVNIVGEPEWVGQTVTVKDSELVIVDTVTLDSAGEGVFTASQPDTYLFTLTYGGQTMEATLSVTQETTYTVVIHGSGSVNLQGWLTAGSTTEHPINPSSYSTFADVEADEEVVRQLMTVHNAVDYLATSDGTDELIGQVINSDICAKWINLRDYALDTLSANSDIKALMDTADKYGYGEWALMPQVPKMTSNTAPYGTVLYSSADTSQSYHSTYAPFDGIGTKQWASTTTSGNDWFGYGFVNPTRINRIVARVYGSRVKDYKIQASNDSNFANAVTLYEGTNSANTEGWVQIVGEFTNTNTFKYYRIYRVNMYRQNEPFSIQMLQFYAWQPKGNVPVMTSNTAPYGEAVAWQSYSGTDAYMAFDGNFSTNWGGTTAGTSYVAYKFTNPVNVKRLSIKCYYISKIEVLYAESHSSDFISLGEFTLDASGETSVTIDLNNSNYGMVYAVKLKTITSNVGAIRELQFYGRELSVSVPTMTSNTAPYGTAIRSSAYSSAYEAYVAFDGKSTSWMPRDGATNNYVGYIFTKPVCVRKVFLTTNLEVVSSSYPCPTRTFKIQASNDGSTWIDLGTIESVGSGTSVTRGLTADIENDTKYSRYRIFCSDMLVYGGRWNHVIRELQFFDPEDYSEREFAEGSTMKYIYDHGVEFDSFVTWNTLSASSTSFVNEENELKTTLTKPNSNNCALGVGTEHNVDVTDYSILRMRAGKTNFATNTVTSGAFEYGAFGVNSSQTGAYGSAYVAEAGLGFPVVVDNGLDISSVNGSMYIYANFDRRGTGTRNTTASIAELWLE